MKLLDTNVFIYAWGRPGPHKEACAAILTRAKHAREAFGVDVEVLQELLEVYARRRQRSAAVSIVEDVLRSFPDPYPIAREQIEEAAS